MLPMAEINPSARIAKIDLAEKFAGFAEHWRPKIIGQGNGQDIRIVKTKGVFPWHSHLDAAETFLCWRGTFRVEFRDHVVELAAGQMVVVPRGIEHRTASDEEAEVIIFETSDVINTGDAAISEFTAPSGVKL
jgi:mannose-6-phosphate isomerase-like protein (cupin superfamily)